MTVAEVADELNCSPATVRSWISRGTLVAFRPGQRKLLIRRSEVDRLIRGEDPTGAARPSRSGSDPRPRRRAPDSTSSVFWTEDDRAAIDPEDWLAVAQGQWLAALSHSQDAPPDAWFAGRLRLIAEAASRKADALGPFPEDSRVWWDTETGGAALVLSHELRAGGPRPGAEDLWTEFDSRVASLGEAIADGRAGSIRRSLEDLALVLHDIADSLDAYRGRYGQWIELPELKPPKEPETPSKSADESVS